MENHNGWLCYCPMDMRVKELNIHARMERYLQMCAKHNMCSWSIALHQTFHVIRRQPRRELESH